MELPENNLTMIELGYYHPSSANWSYRVHMLIDATGARLYKETFGGDSRLRDIMREKSWTVEVLHAGIGSEVQYSWKDVRRMPDIEQYASVCKNWGEGALEMPHLKKK